MAIGIPFVSCWALLCAGPRDTVQSVILPVVDATDIRFSRVTFGSFKREPAYNRVHSIAQDAKGFLWFATQDKLQRYDGYEIREYPNDPDSPVAVFTEAFLLVDRRGILWGGWELGLKGFDPATETFKGYTGDKTFHTKVYSATQDQEGNLWFAADNGLIRMDSETGRTVTYEHNPEDPASLSSNRVRAVYAARDGALWVATKAGVDLFDRRTGKVRQHIRFPADFPDLDPNPVLQMVLREDRAGVLWMTFSYGYGLARINREAGTIALYSLDGTGRDNTLQSGARSIIETEDGALWIGTTGSGLLRLNPERSRFARYRYNQADSNSLSGDQVLGLFLDREGNMWAGTNGAGVNRFSPRPSPFTVYQHRMGDPNSLESNYTTSIFEDSRGLLWIGSLKSLQRLDRKTGKMAFYRRSSGPGELSSTWVISIAEDLSGRLWFGTVGGGVSRLDPRSGKFKVFLHNPADPRSLSHNTSQAILVDHKGVVWVGTEDGLDEFDEATGSFRVYKAGNTLNQSRADYIAEDPGRALWIATQTTGLMRFDLYSHQFISYRHTPDVHSLSDDSADSVCIDHNGMIWVGTQNGLNRLDPRTGTFTRYYERDGLAASNISKILEDSSGDLWVGTSRGLSRFDVRTNRFQNYYVSDGIAGNEFYNYASAFKARTGEMFFSSYAGITSFFPRDVIDNPYVPPVVITDLRVSGKPLPRGGDSPAVPFTKAVKLSHSQNLISLQFSALSFTNPDGNRYRYMMKGLEDSWNESTSDQRFITYSLSPAEYEFRVKGSTSRGAWNEEGTTLRIVILPPWWTTTWFRISSVSVCALAVGFAIWMFLRLRSRQLAQLFEAKRLTEQKAARERAEELVEVNSQLQRSLLRLSEGGDSEELLKQLLLSAAHQLRAGGSALFLYDEESQTIQMVASVGLQSSPHAEAEGSAPLPAASDLLWRSFADSHTILLDARESEEERWLSGLRQQVTPDCPLVLLTPLAVANRLLGYMSVTFPSTLSKKDVSAEQVSLARSLASLAAISIETNRLAKRAQDAALAEERNLLAHELHDTLAGAFTAISMQLQAASDLAGSNEELRTECISRADDLAGYGLRNLREFVQSLTLGSANGSSLALEMQTLLISATSGTGTNGKFTVDGQERSPSSACSQALLRVMQEALGNAQRYAEAKNILVALRFEKDVLSVTISDDGKGFIVAESMDKGFGLTGIKSRVLRLSGRYSLTSSPGAGTEVFVELPYTESERRR